MRRPVVWIACVYLAGLILGQALTYFPFTVLTLLCLTILAEAILLRRGLALPDTNFLFVVLIGGMVYIHLVTWYRPTNDLSNFIEQGKVTLTGFIDQPLVHYPDRSVVILTAQQILVGDRREGVSGRLRLRGSDPFLGQYQYGDILQVQVVLRAPRGLLNPGLFNFGDYLRRQGIRAEGTASHSELVSKLGERPSILLRHVYAWREKIRQAAENSLHDEPLAIFLAMIIGETGHLTNSLRDHFMASGTTHILSISGSHLGLVAMVVFPLTRLAILSLPPAWLLRLGLYCTASQLAALATVFPVVFYALLAGGQVATVRSLIMILVYLLAVLIHREDNLLNALALATILVLLWDPRAIAEISFQLSYGSVLMMALAIEWFRQRKAQIRLGQPAPSVVPHGLRQRLLEKGGLILLSALAAMLGTAPIVAYYFNQVSWVGIFSNLLVVPITGMIIIPLGLFCAIGSLLFEQPSLPLADLLQGLYALFYNAVRFFSEIPWAEFRVASPTLGLIAMIYLWLLAILFCHRWSRFRWVAILLITLLPLAGMASFSMPRSSKPLRITFLDVGQGDSAVVRFPDDTVMVVDGGRTFGEYDLGRLVVAPYLWDQGIRRINYLVATHPQLDHMGGLVFLMERFTIREVWTNGLERQDELYQRFNATLHAKGLPERKISRQVSARPVGPCKVNFLNPSSIAFVHHRPRGVTGRGVGESENNRSIVLKISCSPYHYIFTGDIEKEAEHELSSLGSQLKATVIKVPHHGSRGSIEPAFLEAVSPRIAIISAGAHNPYGHPAPEVLSAYRQLGSEVFRTDQEGAILIEAEGNILRLRRYSDLVLSPVRWDTKMPSKEWENFKKLSSPPFSLVLDKGEVVK